MGPSLSKDGDQVVLSIGTLAPPGTPWINIPEKVLLPRIAKLSNKKVVIKVYGGGVMGEDTDILRKMDIGQLSGCGCTALGILAASPETAVFLLPGFFRNYKEKLSKQFGVSETLAYNVQEMLIYEVSRLEPEWKKEVRDYEARSLKAFQVKCGMKAVPLSAEDQKTIAEAASRVYEKLADKAYPRSLMTDMQKALEAYRTER